MNRAKILSDILSTVAIINEYYNTAPRLHKSPMQVALSIDNFGVKPGSRTHKLTPEEEAELMALDEQDEAAEIKALKADMEAAEAADGSLLG